MPKSLPSKLLHIEFSVEELEEVFKNTSPEITLYLKHLYTTYTELLSQLSIIGEASPQDYAIKVAMLNGRLLQLSELLDAINLQNPYYGSKNNVVA